MSLFGGFIGVTFQVVLNKLRFEPNAGVELSNGTRLQVTSLNSSLQVKSKSITYSALKNSKRMKGAIVFDKPVKVLYKTRLTSQAKMSLPQENEVKIQQIH